MTLEDVRIHIDSVDRELRKLIEKRMSLSYEVACTKLETGDNIYKPDREQLLISGLTQNTRPDILMQYTSLIKKIMLVSREYQYSITLNRKGIEPADYSSSTHVVQEYDIDTHDYGSDISLLEEIVNNNMYVSGFTRTDNNSAHINATNTLIGNEDTDHLLLYTDSNEYAKHLPLILSIITDYGYSVSWLKTTDYSCYIEVEANITKTVTKVMLYMLLTEYNNLKIIGSY